MIHAAGENVETLRTRIFAGVSPGMRMREGWLAAGPAMLGGVDSPLPPIPDRLSAFRTRNNAMLLAAYQQIRSEVEAVRDRVGAHRVAVVIGTSTSGISDGEEALRVRLATGSFPEGYTHAQQEMGSPPRFLARLAGLSGPAYAVATACSSSAKALVAARNLIRMGVCDAAVTGGVDTLCRLTVNGFKALEAVSPRLTNPMSAHRDGLNIGEGAALFLMTAEAGGVALLGAGESSDAHHISAPDPEGRGAEASMRQALADAGLGPSEVEYLNLHGTGTPLNDRMESLAVERIFGLGVPVSSTKPLTGHTLGAAGAIEAGLCWLVAGQEPGPAALPPHLWDGARDPALPALKLVQPGDTLPAGTRRICLSNSFAFGGSNCSLVIGRAEGGA